MQNPQPMIRVPEVMLTLDQLISTIRLLDDQSLSKVVRVILDRRNDDRLSLILQQLAAQSPSDDLSDDEINAEVKIVRARNGIQVHA
ncbi:MAG: hypothetical protein KIH69_023670 [Anaerolineae bacterium]|nr:hypothetical protein [Anaerolineae bacterium]